MLAFDPVDVGYVRGTSPSSPPRPQRPANGPRARRRRSAAQPVSGLVHGLIENASASLTGPRPPLVVDRLSCDLIGAPAGGRGVEAQPFRALKIFEPGPRRGG